MLDNSCSPHLHNQTYTMYQNLHHSSSHTQIYLFKRPEILYTGSSFNVFPLKMRHRNGCVLFLLFRIEAQKSPIQSTNMVFAYEIVYVQCTHYTSNRENANHFACVCEKCINTMWKVLLGNLFDYRYTRRSSS